MDNFIVPKRIYQDVKTGQVSPNLHELLEYRTVLTLRKGFNCDVFGTWKSDPFEEVVTVKPTIPDAWQGLDNRELYSAKVTDTDVFQAIIDVIDRYWNPTKFHVVFHSAGWDSRIISAAIRALCQYHGPDWFGNTLFLSNRWEAEPFYEIMYFSGWNPSQYLAFDEGDEEHHFASTLTDFPNAYRKLNAPVPICSNMWYYLVEWVQAKGVLPTDDTQLQGFSGYWANENWNCARASAQEWYKRYKDWYYYTLMAALPFKILDMIFPLSHRNVVEKVTGRGGIDGNALRKQLALTYLPEAAHIPNPSLDDRHHHIAKDVLDVAVDAYRKSWYGRNVKSNPDISPYSEFAKWWSDWSLASLCDHLVKHGCKIRIV